MYVILLSPTHFTMYLNLRFLPPDLYSKLVAPYLKSGLRVQTWRSGSGVPLPSKRFGTYKVLHIFRLFTSVCLLFVFPDNLENGLVDYDNFFLFAHYGSRLSHDLL